MLYVPMSKGCITDFNITLPPQCPIQINSAQVGRMIQRLAVHSSVQAASREGLQEMCFLNPQQDPRNLNCFLQEQ